MGKSGRRSHYGPRLFREKRREECISNTISSYPPREHEQEIAVPICRKRPSLNSKDI